MRLARSSIPLAIRKRSGSSLPCAWSGPAAGRRAAKPATLTSRTGNCGLGPGIRQERLAGPRRCWNARSRLPASRPLSPRSVSSSRRECPPTCRSRWPAPAGGQRLDNRIVHLRAGAFHFMAALLCDMPSAARRAVRRRLAVLFRLSMRSAPARGQPRIARSIGPYCHQPGRKADVPDDIIADQRNGKGEDGQPGCAGRHVRALRLRSLPRATPAGERPPSALLHLHPAPAQPPHTP